MWARLRRVHDFISDNERVIRAYLALMAVPVGLTTYVHSTQKTSAALEEIAALQRDTQHLHAALTSFAHTSGMLMADAVYEGVYGFDTIRKALSADACWMPSTDEERRLLRRYCDWASSLAPMLSVLPPSSILPRVGPRVEALLSNVYVQDMLLSGGPRWQPLIVVGNAVMAAAAASAAAGHSDVAVVSSAPSGVATGPDPVCDAVAVAAGMSTGPGAAVGAGTSQHSAHAPVRPLVHSDSGGGSVSGATAPRRRGAVLQCLSTPQTERMHRFLADYPAALAQCMEEPAPGGGGGDEGGGALKCSYSRQQWARLRAAAAVTG